MAMKKVQAALALFPVSALLITGCFFGGEGDESHKGLVDTYTPAYTAAKGTAYAGDYFPLVAGTQVPIQGTVTSDLHMTVSGTSGGQPVNQDTTVRVSMDMTGLVKTLAAQAVAFPSGTRQVVPMEVQATVSSSDPADSMTLPSTTDNISYYEAAAEALYLRGKDSAGVPTESAKPIFLMLPLTVGESWESAGSDVSSLGEAGGPALRSRTYVTGRESITAGGKTRDAVRLDQIVSMNGPITSEGVSMNINADFHAVIYLGEGVGMLKQSISGTMDINGAASGPGGSVKVVEHMAMSMTQTLAGDPAVAKAAAKVAPAGPATLAHAPAAWTAFHGTWSADGYSAVVRPAIAAWLVKAQSAR
jgi:hypothetical protein